MRSRNNQKDNKPLSDSSALKALQNNIIMRAVLGVIALVLTLVLIFSLTIAWSTNVVQSGGLTFTAEKWDFDGTVTVSTNGIFAAPGDRGTVSMKIQNNGQVAAAASVTVSKDQMDLQMKQRMYFYIEDNVVRNGETVSRVYVSTKSSYTYTVFPGSTIYMDESGQNAPALQWEWVYDVLGYYIYGTLKTTTESDGITQTPIMVTEDYLRPIVYDYDPSMTTFDAAGNLVTVDGEKTVDELLAEISADDGYEGTIDVSKRNELGYYPVSVDANTGRGVWAYLCNYTEINANTEYDTSIGTSETAVSCTAKIIVTGRNIEEDVVLVSNETEFLAAVHSNSGGKIVQLSDDIVVSEPIILDKNSTTMIDLNGYTLSSSTPNIITATTNSNLMILNGKLRAGGDITKDGTEAINVSGADVTLSNVVIENCDDGIGIYDNKNTDGADSKVHLVKSSIKSNDIGIFIRGNGDVSEERTVLIIEDSAVVGENYAGIFGNGGQCGTDIQISNSTIEGKWTSIYHPQLYNSKMTVTSSTLKGYTGLVIKSGTVKLHNCRIVGTSPSDQIEAPGYAVSGFYNTGDGVYIEANYPETHEGSEINVNITGDQTVITSESALAVRKYKDDAPNTVVTIHAGSYSSDVSAYIADGVAVTPPVESETAINKYYMVLPIDNTQQE